MTFHFIFTVMLSGPDLRTLEEVKGKEKRNEGGLEGGGGRMGRD